MPERVRRLGAVLSGVSALLYLFALLLSLWSVITGKWQTQIKLPDAPWPVWMVYLLVSIFLCALLICALACAWCAAQWWMGHTRRARIGSLVCLASGLLLFGVSGYASIPLMLPALTLLYWKAVMTPRPKGRGFSGQQAP
ncbi:hypothetical protein ACFOPQ_12225 [Deinococcus antarcticus]|uniref:Uncharacterized protein n=1 Tax=Deinococcus antarcticus TaxID=1298767 RepID=A0ABV8ABI6_9DEIO